MAGETPKGQGIDLHRERLVAFYKKHNPEKLSTVDEVLEKYKGRERKLFSSLNKKYHVDDAGDRVSSEPSAVPLCGGPQPDAPKLEKAKEKPKGSSLGPYRERLVAFYEKHNPEKISTVDEVLDKFKGREDELFSSLSKKYRVDDASESKPMEASAMAPQPDAPKVEEPKLQDLSDAPTPPARSEVVTGTLNDGPVLERGSAPERLKQPPTRRRKQSRRKSSAAGAARPSTGTGIAADAPFVMPGNNAGRRAPESRAKCYSSVILENKDEAEAAEETKRQSPSPDKTGPSGLLYQQGKGGAPVRFKLQSKQERSRTKKRRKQARKQFKAAVAIQSSFRQRVSRRAVAERSATRERKQRERGATRLQSLERGRRARAELNERREAAMTLQRAHRGSAARRVARERQSERFREHEGSVVKIQARARGKLARRESSRRARARERVRKDDAERERSVVRIQAAARGRSARKLVSKPMADMRAQRQHDLQHALEEELRLVQRDLEHAKKELERERARRAAAQRTARSAPRQQLGVEAAAEGVEGAVRGVALGAAQLRLQEAEAELARQREENAALRARIDQLERSAEQGRAAAAKAERMVLEAEEVLTMKEAEVADLRRVAQSAEHAAQLAREQERSRVRIEMEHLRAEVEWRARYAANRGALERGIDRAFSGSELMAQAS